MLVSLFAISRALSAIVQAYSTYLMTEKRDQNIYVWISVKKSRLKTIAWN